MRIIHTSDWHLGKSFGTFPLRDDQALFTDWFVDLVRSEKPDLVVIAGDIYDRAIAPIEAIELFRDTMERLLTLGVRVAAITGNHDAADRVVPYGGLTDHAGFFIRGGYDDVGSVTTIEFPDGPLDLVMIPFLDPQAAPDDLDAGPETNSDPLPHVEVDTSDDVEPSDITSHLIARRRSRTHESVLRAAIDRARPRMTSPRSVAVTHAFVSGSQTSESERELTVGGSAAVPSEIFEGFSYTALGHLHRPQQAGSTTIRYSGAPLAYSFSEDHEKSVVIVDMAPDGGCTVDTIPVSVGRRVCTIRGDIGELLEPGRFPDAVDRFVRAEITDRETVLDARTRLAEIYPWVAEIRLVPSGQAHAIATTPIARETLSPIDIVMKFWEAVEGSPPDDEVQSVLVTAVERARGHEESWDTHIPTTTSTTTPTTAPTTTAGTRP